MINNMVSKMDHGMVNKEVQPKVSNGEVRMNKSVLVNIQVSNGDNRMNKSDLVNIQVNNGDNRSNSKD